MGFKCVVLVPVLMVAFGCTTGPQPISRILNAGESKIASSLEEQELIEEVPAVARSIDFNAAGKTGRVDRFFSETVHCDVAQTGAYKLPECVRAVTAAEELEVIEIGTEGLNVPFE
jgi:hypothetical protein